jgi:SSS family solute:Na+ symporter
VCTCAGIISALECVPESSSNQFLSEISKMDGQLRTTDLAVLIMYLGAVFGLGCWFARKSGTTQEFMAAGGSIPGWAVGLSILGTYVSSIGFLGSTGKAFVGNWNSWVFGLSLPIAAWIAVKYFVPLYRERNVVSAYSQLETRFGPWARLYALTCFLLSQLARVGAILYLVALALQPLTGWDVQTIIILTGVMVTVYTMLGGIEAVIWTDVVQSIVLIAGAFLCAGLLLTEMPEGPGQLFEVANASKKFSVGDFSLAPDTFMGASPTFWMVLIYGIFINLQNFGINQGFVQRYITAKSDEDARFSVWLGAIMFPMISILFFFIGTGLFSLYHTDTALLEDVKRNEVLALLKDDGVDPSTVTEEQVSDRANALKLERQEEVLKVLEKGGVEPTEDNIAAKVADIERSAIGDKVLPHFIVNKLPIGMAGLLIAAIFAAAMSSIDTSLNSAASLVLCDIFQRYSSADLGEKKSMTILYTATLGFGLVGTVAALAIYVFNAKSILDLWWDLEGIFAGGMLGLFLLGMISRRAQNPQAIIAGIVGVLVIIWASISGREAIWPESLSQFANPLHSFMTIVLGTCSIVLVGAFLGMFASQPSTNK